MGILYWGSIYQPIAVKVIAGFFFLMGCYLMFNPNWLQKTQPQDITQLHSEFRKLFNLFASTKLTKEKRRVELLSEFRLKYFGIGILGCFFVFAICFFIFFLPDLNSLIGLFAVFIYGAVFILSEGEESFFGKKIQFPFSRSERVKIDYFFRILKSSDLTTDVLEEEDKQMIEFSPNKDKVFSNEKSFHITMNRYHVVNNNDNRVLNNNFNTTIENKESESRYEIQLDINSEFWTYYKMPTINSTNQEKVEHFMALLNGINHKHEALESRRVFKNDIEINKVRFINPINSGSEPIIFAGFVKFLLQEELIEKLITDSGIRKCLLDIFEIEGTAPFKNFQPSRWEKDLEYYVDYLSRYK